jgi:hypothetical protein
MPGLDVEQPYQDRDTLAPHSGVGSPPVQWYTLRPLFIAKIVQKRLRCFEVNRLEAFGKPGDDRLEKNLRIGRTALVAQ